MKNKKTLTFKFARTIQASPQEAFNAWLNPKIPGNPWHENNKLIFNPKVNGFFFWYIRGTPHYGRFTELKRGKKIQHTWMSPYTLGQESVVTLTFKKKNRDTVMTLAHSKLPNHKLAKGHKEGWEYFMNKVEKYFKKSSRNQ